MRLTPRDRADSGEGRTICFMMVCGINIANNNFKMWPWKLGKNRRIKNGWHKSPHLIIKLANHGLIIVQILCPVHNDSRGLIEYLENCRQLFKSLLSWKYIISIILIIYSSFKSPASACRRSLSFPFFLSYLKFRCLRNFKNQKYQFLASILHRNYFLYFIFFRKK